MKILVFSAVWCPGCLVMDERFNKIREDYPELDIIHYDSEMDDNIFDEYNIGDRIPVIIYVDKNNNELERLIGEKSIKELVNLIEAYREM